MNKEPRWGLTFWQAWFLLLFYMKFTTAPDLSWWWVTCPFWGFGVLQILSFFGDVAAAYAKQAKEGKP